MGDNTKLTGFNLVNLELMINSIGEDKAKEVLSDFSCPKNPDVEGFLKFKAIEFSRKGLSSTHLVFTSYKENPVLIGYFTLTQKPIEIAADHKMSKTLRSRVCKFGTFDVQTKTYRISASLIAQLGKNYSNGYNKLITGNELLELAINKIRNVQLEVGGRIIYLECEDVEPLNEFYDNYGFVDFGERNLDSEEKEVMHGKVLKQKLIYLKKEKL